MFMGTQTVVLSFVRCVRAIRDVIRVEDLIFRWCGDEFFVLMIGFNADEVNERMTRLDRLLSAVHVEGVQSPMTIGVSRAFANFADLANLESTIERADAGMYQQKLARRANPDATMVGQHQLAPESVVEVV